MKQIKIDEQKVWDIIRYDGNKAPMIVMEECGELIQAISKVERADLKDKRKVVDEKLTEEMCDVYICLSLLHARYNIDYEMMEKAIDEKMTNFLERINKGEDIR